MFSSNSNFEENISNEDGNSKKEEKKEERNTRKYSQEILKIRGR